MSHHKRVLPENALSTLVLSLAEIEDKLMLQKVFIRTDKGSLWKLRRNGATKLWKTRSGEFRIPVKFGWKYFGYITQDNKFKVCNTITGVSGIEIY